ncbi:MAG: hypothetical protein Q4E69_07250 [Bacilli bacterium]|nr:hypothetical protein [Bacilli bacterium]
MKLKKKTKIFLVILFLILVVVLGFLVYKNFFSNKEVKETKVIASIDDYGYKLKDNKNATYKKMFDELKEILLEKEVDYEKYASKISEMFIYDFYSLEDKAAKNDIGGVDFIHPDALDNFLENAENTYYKYVESNIYGNRTQSLPMVDEVTISKVEPTNYIIGETPVEEAYAVTATWTYTNESFNDYQKSATLYLVRVKKNLYIVELK